MRLYTVGVHHHPLLVMSVDTEPAMEEFVLRDPKLLQATRQINDFIASLPDDVKRVGDQCEIDEAVDTWLGKDLRSKKVDGIPIWNGDHSALFSREARFDEAAVWHDSRKRAIETGEHDAGDEDWIVWL